MVIVIKQYDYKDFKTFEKDFQQKSINQFLLNYVPLFMPNQARPPKPQIYYTLFPKIKHPREQPN